MACASVAAHAEGSPESLADARALWGKVAPTSYSYLVEEHSAWVSGFCKGPKSTTFSSKEVRITVREGRVIRIASRSNDEFPASCLEGLALYKHNLHTIEGLFTFIEREQAANGGRPNVGTKYDATFGFPSYVSERDVLDGSSYTVRDFRVVN
jgi:hypothetical protein